MYHLCAFSGILSQFNLGKPNTQIAQFFICLAPCPHFDGKYAAFGKVIEGMEIVRKAGEWGSASGQPSKKVEIADCGEVDPDSAAASAIASGLRSNESVVPAASGPSQSTGAGTMNAPQPSAGAAAAPAPSSASTAATASEPPNPLSFFSTSLQSLSASPVSPAGATAFTSTASSLGSGLVASAAGSDLKFVFSSLPEGESLFSPINSAASSASTAPDFGFAPAQAHGSEDELWEEDGWEVDEDGTRWYDGWTEEQWREWEEERAAEQAARQRAAKQMWHRGAPSLPAPPSPAAPSTLSFSATSFSAAAKPSSPDPAVESAAIISNN